MKEYDKFTETELPNIEKKLEAKKQLKLTPQQEKDARLFQENTSMVLNKHREELFNKTVEIESFSETFLNAIDIVSTAIGAKNNTFFLNSLNKWVIQ